jgi:hypothetical protein
MKKGGLAMRKIWELVIIFALILAFGLISYSNIAECQYNYNPLYNYFDINNNQFGMQYTFGPNVLGWSGQFSGWPALSAFPWNSTFNSFSDFGYMKQGWSWYPESFTFSNYLNWSPVSYMPSFSSNLWSSVFNNNYSNNYLNFWPYVSYKNPPSPPPSATNDADCCSPQQIAAGYKCMRDCGPPVVSSEDPISITYSCLSPEQVEARELYGCPICLSSDTMISTPNGDINVKELKVGMTVWSINTNGKKTAQPLLKVSSTPVPVDHKVVHLVLEDGRALRVSPKHPTEDGRTVEELKAGNTYDGSIIKSIALEQYSEEKTYDLLPAGETGHYWANGILMGSTL